MKTDFELSRPNFIDHKHNTFDADIDQQSAKKYAKFCSKS